jgi:hypothetical protein
VAASLLVRPVEDLSHLLMILRFDYDVHVSDKVHYHLPIIGMSIEITYMISLKLLFLLGLHCL